MESFGDMNRRVIDERANLEAQREMNAEILYARQQRLRRAIVFVCNNLIKNNVPHFNLEVEPAKYERAPITSIFGKVKGYEDKVVEKPKIVRGWAIDKPYIHCHDDRSNRKYYEYSIITEDGEYYTHVETDTSNKNIPQADNISSKQLRGASGLKLASTKEELKFQDYKDRIYNEAETKLVNFAIDNNIDLSEIE